MLKKVIFYALIFSVAYAAAKSSTIFNSKTGYSLDLEGCWTPVHALASNSKNVEESRWIELERVKNCPPVLFESKTVDLFSVSVSMIDKNFWPKSGSKYDYGRIKAPFYFESKSKDIQIPFNLQIMHSENSTRWEYGLFCPDIFVLLEFGFVSPMQDPKEVEKLRLGSAAIPKEIKKLIDSFKCKK